MPCDSEVSRDCWGGYKKGTFFVVAKFKKKVEFSQGGIRWQIDLDW